MNHVKRRIYRKILKTCDLLERVLDKVEMIWEEK